MQEEQSSGISSDISVLCNQLFLSSILSLCLCRQLLLPHVRYTIAINTKAREQLICECGLFDKVGVRISGHQDPGVC